MGGSTRMAGRRWSWWMAVCAAWACVSPVRPARAELGNGTVVGRGQVVQNLTVFPVLSAQQRSVGAVTTLDAALAAGEAEVRELGDKSHDGAQVNTLVIDNRGGRAIFVLAGTVVKGGKQDRQIGQDLLVEPHAAVSVDAFCVEHGRWNGQRNGRDTSGKFGTLQQLASSEVRRAGQYKADQGEVWHEVAEVNRKHGKQTGSGTLMATLDAKDVAQRQKLLAGMVMRVLSEVPESTVGIAYAVDGKVRGIRWFANADIFGLFREALSNTAAMDALTAQAEHGLRPPPGITASHVEQFVRDVEHAQARQERDTRGANTNEIKESSGGYGSRTKLKRRTGRPAAEEGTSISVDYLAK